MQGTWIQSLVQEDSKCSYTAKPMYHSYWSLHALSPMLCNKPRQLESSPPLPQLDKVHAQQQRPSTGTNKLIKINKQIILRTY